MAAKDLELEPEDGLDSINSEAEDVPGGEASAGAEAKSVSELRKFLAAPRGLPVLLLSGLLVIGIIYLLHFAKLFLLPVVLALLLNFLLKPLVRHLTRIHLPPALGAGLVLALLFTILGMGLARLYEPAVDWIAKAPESLREVEVKVKQLLLPAQQLNRAAEQVENMTTISRTGSAAKFTFRQTSLADAILSFTWSFLGSALEMLVLLYFLLAVGDLFRTKLIKVLPPEPVQTEAMTITEEVERKITTYLATVTVINAVLGLLVGAAMYMLNLPNPALWGVVAAFLNFIPYIGPAVGVAILLVVGLLSFDTVGQALLPPLTYISLHALEANFVTPMVLGRRLILNPVVIFISIMFWTWLWGVPGALLAVPMLMTLKIVCDHVLPLRNLGEFLGR
jgi:predicted PurR-regulated permease PerM